MKKNVFLFAALLLILGCRNENKKESTDIENFETENVLLDSTRLSACKDKPCPKVKVNYLKVEGASDFSRAVNKKNKEELIKIFNLTEEQPIAKSLEEAVNDFVNDYFKFKKDFPSSSEEYEAEVDQETLSHNDSTVVFKTSYYIYTGGAHGFSGVNFSNFDARTGQYLTKKDLIADIPAFTQFAEKKFREKYNIPEDVDINSKGFFFDDEKFALPNNIAVTRDTVILLYNPYEAASYAQGTLRFSFPKKKVAQWLNY